ncbi:hypothetical protein FIBSPDRAFT_1038215 [Athelia psychrophila]|uniref:Fungal-type protein kinase domain-containing protein n=1 Tax=Athelia psychrophila TaxID=1759441 RepID=A0A166TFF5_9AGAM|nr:hypothetical protein FIBSPDRAFT_1038215 [Fibularhizoctonia sp. CBS 109695]
MTTFADTCQSSFVRGTRRSARLPSSKKCWAFARSEEEKKQARCGPRTPRLLMFKELDGIETLSSGELLKAFADIVDCHYSLWIGGIKHCDISPGNLMWDSVEKSGVLNDYDLSRNSVPHSRNLRRTGTIPFLSLDLLEQNLNFRPGGVEPTYNHDCDSLKWVFLYICCVEKSGKICRWLTADMETSLDIRTAYLFSLRPFQGGRKHATLSQHGQTVYWLLQDARLAVLNHDRAFNRGTGPEVYVGDTDFELYSALKSSIQ